MDTGEGRFCQSPWLNQGHTVEFSADGKRLLVGSAGFDAVFEFDTATGEVVWEWFAWDHGFDRSKMGHYVVRSAAKYAELSSPWVTKCFWWMIQQNTNLDFLLGKNRRISIAPATTRMEEF